MQAPGVVQSRINQWVIVQIFAVIDAGFLEFIDGRVNLFDGFFFLVSKFAAIMVIQVGPSSPQIREGVKVSRVLALSEGAGNDRERNREKQRKA